MNNLMRKLTATAILLSAFLATTAAYASKKVALVIGNSAYDHVAALPNPKNDAMAISASLKSIGFDVTTANDLTFQKMRLALRAFSESPPTRAGGFASARRISRPTRASR